MTLTHASFFSGAGGLDMGLERVGWTTVSFSEIDAYASAVLATRWPGIPNLGSITDLAGGRSGVGSGEQLRQHAGDRPDAGTHGAWTVADLWSGGFPCQDLSVAGKRRGMGTDTDRLDTRSGLAYAFLDLVERYRPPAIILENVPGLLSSHRGRDFHALQRRMAELGYVGAYRILDARYFGVPQRRRRVFIVALAARLGATEDDAAEVLSVGTRCDRHPATGGQAGPGVAERPAPGVDIARAVTGSSGKHHDDDTDTLIAGALRRHSYADHISDEGRLVVANGLRASDGHHGHGSPRGDGGDNLLVSPSPDSRGVRAADGLAGRMDNRAGVAFASSPEDDESWRTGDVAPTLNSFDVGDARTTVAVVTPDVAATVLSSPDGGTRTTDLNQTWVDGIVGDADLLPLGLDSHRYRCCGNGVVAPVAEFVGERLRAVLERMERVA